MIKPHTQHIYYADQYDPWNYIWIVFKGLAVPQYLRACGLSKSNAVYRPKDYTVQTNQKIKEHLLTIFDNPNASRSFIIGHLHLFFNALEENAALSDTKKIPETSLSNIYLSEAIRYIESHYPNIRSLDEISAFCNVSRSHLSRLFRENLHTSLQDYLIQYRLSKAKELLVNTSLPIYEIAYKVGYLNELNLLRAFRSRYGIAPNTYRKQNTL